MGLDFWESQLEAVHFLGYFWIADDTGVAQKRTTQRWNFSYTEWAGNGRNSRSDSSFDPVPSPTCKLHKA
jgi:hypothetical protein